MAGFSCSYPDGFEFLLFKSQLVQHLLDYSLRFESVPSTGRWFGTETRSEVQPGLRQETIVLEIKKILLATDLGGNSERATEYARLFVGQFNAELHVLHVLEDVPTNTPVFGGGIVLNTYVHESASVAEQKIHALFESSWRIGKQLVAATADGEPSAQILRYAKELHVDLIVLGTHGRSGLSQILLGSVAAQVTHHATCPVVVVRSRLE